MLCHGLGQSARNHAEDPLSLPAASLYFRRKYPLPAQHPVLRTKDFPFRPSENGLSPSSRALNERGALPIWTEARFSFFLLSNRKGYRKTETIPTNKSPPKEKLPDGTKPSAMKRMPIGSENGARK